MRETVLSPRKPNHLDIFPSDFTTLHFPNAIYLKRKLDIREHRPPWKQSEVLKDHAAIFARTLYVLTVDENLAFVMLQQASYQTQKRCLSASAGAKKANELAPTDIE
jgi:hypothetical protein